MRSQVIRPSRTLIAANSEELVSKVRRARRQSQVCEGALSVAVRRRNPRRFAQDALAVEEAARHGRGDFAGCPIEGLLGGRGAAGAVARHLPSQASSGVRRSRGPLESTRARMRASRPRPREDRSREQYAPEDRKTPSRVRLDDLTILPSHASAFRRRCQSNLLEPLRRIRSVERDAMRRHRPILRHQVTFALHALAQAATREEDRRASEHGDRRKRDSQPLRQAPRASRPGLWRAIRAQSSHAILTPSSLRVRASATRSRCPTEIAGRCR